MKYKVTFGIGLDKTAEGKPLAGALKATGYNLNKAIRYLQTETARYFGGYTAVRGQGGWYDRERGKLVEERSLTLTTYVDGDRGLSDARELAALCARTLLQSQVLFSYTPAVLEFVDAAPAQAEGRAA